MNTWTTSSYNSQSVPVWVDSTYGDILPYVTEFLTAKHPYRNGVMCPFVPQALKNKTIYFTYFDNHDISGSAVLLDSCIELFKQMVGDDHGAIIILFRPDFAVADLLAIHIDNKIKCIKNFIMLGALYKNSSASSLHSEYYFPLRTPTPSLVLRDITSSDLAFLEPDHYSPFTKIIFLSAFIRRFSRKKSISRFTTEQVCQAKVARRSQIKSIIINKRAGFSGLVIIGVSLLYFMV